MNSAFTLRPAVAANVEACAAIMRGWMQETDWFHTHHLPNEDGPFLATKIAAGTMIVAEKNGEIAGFLVLEGDFVGCLYLAPAHRGRGLGKQFMDVARAKNPSGLNLWTFQANSGARRFYEREGFTVEMMTDGAGNDEKIPDVMYVWEGVKP